MVQLTELVAEHFEQRSGLDEDEDCTDTDSDISNESDYDPIDETLAERLYALCDIIPPQTRGAIASKLNATSDGVKSMVSFSGKALWVICSSALLLGVPWTLAWAEEQQVVEMDKELRMREMGGEVLTAGGQTTGTAEQIGSAISKEAKPAL